jgi:glycosidase
MPPRYPALYQLATRLRLAELARTLGRPATLDDLPDAELDRLAADGFDLVWLLGVWQTGEAARRVSAANPEWLADYRRVLPDLAPGDVTGSCFAVRDYRVHADFGGDAALARLRDRLRRRGLGLVLDFVPNHVAPDHPWVRQHPDWLVAGDEASLAREPRNYRRVEGGRVIAYGRDPFFDGWPDTFQLDYSNPALRSAMQAELARVARLCDGVRCDMAMLVLPEVFERTWGRATEPFWPRATSAVRAARPGFLFLAEVYWDLEWTLQQQGFDYTYDKRLYDRLAHGAARAVRDHLRAGLDFQDRLARFLENHDEPRAAATFAPERHRAAAIVTFLAPGLRFLHQGQREGRRIRVPVHLGRGPEERVDAELGAFYDRLLATLRDRAVREGEWRLLEARAAWEGNPTWDDFIAFAWTRGGERRLVVVNFSDHRSQCWLPLPWGELGGATVRLRDRTGPAVYDRDARELAARGLYLDLPAWGYHVFEVAPA